MMESGRSTKVLAGFPVEKPFDTKEEVEAYLSHNKIQCLLCGGLFKSLGMHLRMSHAMSPEEYKEIYNIPWRRGLCCPSTYEKHSVLRKAYIAEHGCALTPEIIEQAHNAKRRPMQKVIRDMVESRIRNYNKVAGNTGEEQRRRENAPKRGTPEYKESMRRRPQAGNPQFIGWWKSKHQSPEHIRKRIEAGLRTRAKNKQKSENGFQS